MYTAGALVAGALWSHQEWGTWWRWAPGETAALIVWTVATIYIHGRTLPGWRKTNSALFAVLVFGSAVAALFADLIFGGLSAAGA
jgi:ABC-type transport system involved in cytochrome c biogenesis permease subunit